MLYEKLHFFALLVCSLVLNSALGYKYRIGNKTDIRADVIVYPPGRTYLAGRPSGDTVSHTKPIIRSVVEPGEYMYFETTGGECIGAIETIMKGYIEGRVFGGGRDVFFPAGGREYGYQYIDSSAIRCYSKNWKIIYNKNTGLDLQGDSDNPEPTPWTLINDSGHEISVYHSHEFICDKGPSQKIKYHTLGSTAIKDGKLENLCLDKLVAPGEKVGLIHAGGTLYILYYYITGAKEQYPILYELRNPVKDRVYHFNPHELWLSKNPLEVRDGKALTVQEPPNGFWLENEETRGKIKKRQEAYETLKKLIPSGAPITKQFKYKTDTGMTSDDVNILHIAVMQGNVDGVKGIIVNVPERSALLKAKADIKRGDAPLGNITPKVLAEQLKGLVAQKIAWGMGAVGAKLRKAGLTEKAFNEIINALKAVGG